MGDPVAQPLQDFNGGFIGGISPVHGLHHRLHLLAEFLVGNAEHGDVRHLLVAHQFSISWG
jgi:hypothetical protein